MQYLKKEVRDNIIRSAIDEFKNYGFANASIRNIANNANISLGNIYRYFINKEALYFAVVNPLMESIKKTIDLEFSDKYVSLKQATEKFVDFLMEHADEFLIVRRGNSVHYNAIVDYLVEATAVKINTMMNDKYSVVTTNKVKNPEFARIVASGFLHGLFQVLKGTESIDQKRRYVKELITFYFAKLGERFD